MDESAFRGFYRDLIVMTGAGIFTDCFNQFIIAGAAISLVATFHTIDALTISLALFLSGSFVGAVLWGRLADILGRRYTLVINLAVLATVGFLSGLISSLPELYASRFIVGLAAGGDYPVAASLLTEFSPKNQRGRLLSLTR
jgi:MFS transporter, PHS family, inorganic phosphate transporter